MLHFSFFFKIDAKVNMVCSPTHDNSLRCAGGRSRIKGFCFSLLGTFLFP